MKKVTSLLCILAVIISCCVLGGTGISAAEDDFTYKALDSETAQITGYNGSAKNVVVPSSIDGLEVVSIGAQAFYQNTTIENVTLPDTVSSIGFKAFSGSYIKSITMTDSVVELGNNAFSFCIYLTDVTLSGGLNIISNNCFSNCTRLEEITIPEGVSIIDISAFQSCYHLYDISLPSTLTTIEEYAFAYCPFTSVSLPEELEEIKATAFFQCQNLESITIPGSVKSIGDFAFSGCISLCDLTICDGVSSIGAYAFDACPIETAVIPESVTDIGLYSIGYTDNLFDVIKSDDLVITCKENSIAHQYAINNEFYYILTDNHVPVIPTTTEPVTIAPTTVAPTTVVPTTTAPTSVPYTTTPSSSSNVPVPKSILGDADQNGTVNVKDATAIQKVIAGLGVTSYDEQTADADENGIINIKDATAIQKWVAGLIINSNIGK